MISALMSFRQSSKDFGSYGRLACYGRFLSVYSVNEISTRDRVSTREGFSINHSLELLATHTFHKLYVIKLIYEFDDGFLAWFELIKSEKETFD